MDALSFVCQRRPLFLRYLQRFVLLNRQYYVCGLGQRIFLSQRFEYFPLSVCLPGFWREVCRNPHLVALPVTCPLPASFWLLPSFSLCLHVSFSFNTLGLNVDCLVFSLPDVLWASWICGLVSVINSVKSLANHTSNISSILFSSSFCYFHVACVTPFEIVPKFTDLPLPPLVSRPFRW